MEKKRKEKDCKIDPDDSRHYKNLDKDFFPLLQSKLCQDEKDLQRTTAFRDSYDFDEVDKGLFREPAEDVIDARGTFDPKQVERELRENGEDLGISLHKVKQILRRADKHKTGRVKYKDFLVTVGEYRLNSEQESKLRQFVHALAYVEEFHSWPPPVFMILITAMELAFYLYLTLHLKYEHGLEITWDGPVPYCSVLIYNPERRYEAWRFITYMFVHIGIGHFVFNMIMQIIIGVFLEMEQEGWLGSLRVATVYIAGVAAGSLGTSIADPDTYIAGASGGVYALIAAHLATLALNWKEDSAVKIRKVVHQPLTRIVRLIFIILLTVHDVALAIYVRFFSDGDNRTGFMGHLCGALAGLLVGIFVLDNRRVRKWEPIIQWLALILFAGFVVFAVLWNIFGNEWTGKQFYPPQSHQPYDDESGNCNHYDYF